MDLRQQKQQQQRHEMDKLLPTNRIDQDIYDVEGDNGGSGSSSSSSSNGSESYPKFPSVRIYVSFLSLIGTAIMYLTRVNLNVAILAMVNTTSTQIPDDYHPVYVSINYTRVGLDMDINDDNDYQCPVASVQSFLQDQGLNTAPAMPLMHREFYWSPPEQGIVLGAFFYGYIWPQIFAGRLSELYGAKYLILISILVSGLINLFTPIIVRTNFTLFIVSRVVLGCFQGIIYPAFYALFAKWIPDSEHSTFMPWLDSGITIGTVIASAGAGNIIDNDIMGGWPTIFYLSGILALIWCIVWQLTITSTPGQHQWISKRELHFICKHNTIPAYEAPTVGPTGDQPIDPKLSIPWRRIFTSKPFMATLIAKVTYGITFDFMTTKIPAYLQDVIHFPIDQNGYTYSFIMIGFTVTLLTCGWLADKLIKTHRMSKTNVRKVFQTISGTGMAASLCLLPSVGCSKPGNIALLTICMLAYGFTSGGDVPIVPDMTDQFAGTVFAVMNTLCSFSGFVVPYFVGVLIDSKPTSMLLWSYTFYAAAAIDLFGTLVFVAYASARPQHWEASQPPAGAPNDPHSHDVVREVNAVPLDEKLPLLDNQFNGNKMTYHTSCQFSVP